MKILAFVDTHGNEAAHKKIVEKAKDVDLVICLGDFTQFESGMEKVLQQFNEIGKPVIIMHGNHENPAALMRAASFFKNIHFLHLSHIIFEDMIFFGYGGGGFAIEDRIFEKASEAFIKYYKDHGLKHKIILLTHQPPFGTRLDDLGYHVGNTSMTKFIVNHQPYLALAGHIHECEGREDHINKTILMNPGQKGIILEL